MKYLGSRLQRLEAVLTDSTGLVPHSQEWLDYWGERLDRVLNGEIPKPMLRIPLAAMDALLAAALENSVDQMATDNVT